MAFTNLLNNIFRSISDELKENRVPAIVFSYWAIKIAATTLGETGADMFSMTFNLGYASTSIIFISIFLIFLATKLSIRKYHPTLYWVVFTATSIVGTAMSDFMDRTLGFGYTVGTIVLITLLLIILVIWRSVEKSLSVENINTPQAEIFYWIAFLVANTLGTALGDFLADSSGLGFAGGAMLISGLLLVTVLLYYFTKVSRVLLFWIAFVLTRPFGATFGDLLTKPIKAGGLNLGTIGSSAFFALVLIYLIFKEHTNLKNIRVEEAELD